MSKHHNYSQYFADKAAEVAEPEIVEETVTVEEPVVAEPAVVIEPVEETVETVTLPATVKGVVAYCNKLNVRESGSASAAVVCILDAGSEIEIDVNKSSSEWLCVYTATGAEGYCMRKFVDARL